MARAPAATEIDDLPEAGVLCGFPHPRLTAKLYGHDAAERQLAEAFASGRMHHGWLITGAEGIGKSTLAYRFARFVLARPDERDMFASALDVATDTTAARQVRALSHPNLMVLARPYDSKAKRLKTEIPVDEVRRLKSLLSLVADEDAWRVVIVDPCDELNASAANALLKSLEEPPERTIFLLVSSSPGQLLTTLRSRCRTLELAPLATDALRRAVTQAIAASGEEIAGGIPVGTEWDVLERLSGGSARRFLSLQCSGGLDLYKRIFALVAGLPKTDWDGVHAFGDELASLAAGDRFELFYDLLLGLLARMVRQGAGLPGDAEEGRQAARLMPQARLATWAAVWETLVAEKADADALNLDRKSLILDTFSRLEIATRT